MLGAEHRVDDLSGLVTWGGRDRASKVVAAAATIAHGWDRLDEAELERLGEALEDHTRSYLEWIADLSGAEIHDVRGVLMTIVGANTLFRQTSDPSTRRSLAETLASAASTLVECINTTSIAVAVDLDLH